MGDHSETHRIHLRFKGVSGSQQSQGLTGFLFPGRRSQLMLKTIPPEQTHPKNDQQCPRKNERKQVWRKTTGNQIHFFQALARLLDLPLVNFTRKFYDNFAHEGITHIPGVQKILWWIYQKGQELIPKVCQNSGNKRFWVWLFLSNT